MDNQNQIPAVSTAEAEAFWTGGNDARQPETGADLQSETSKKILIAWIPYIHEWREVFECDHGRYYCLDPGDGLGTHIKDGDGIEVVETTEADCLIAATAWTLAHPQEEIGIDTPGVGVVRPEVSSLELRSGRESAGDGVGERSPDLVGSLIAAARELALAQIEPADEREPAFCTECTKDATDGGAIAHEDDCLTGRVIRSIVNLVESRQISKEAATDGEMPEAGEGIRPRGALDVRGLAALLMFEHTGEPHHSHLCKVCRRAFELGIKPIPLDGEQGLFADVQRENNEKGDGYFGAFSVPEGGAR